VLVAAAFPVFLRVDGSSPATLSPHSGNRFAAVQPL
jgi:hypothetical protein